jgi:hypothetical protein
MTGIDDFVMAVPRSMTIHAVGDRKLGQMTKTRSACAVLFKVTDERVFRRCQQKYKCQLEAFRAFITKI